MNTFKNLHPAVLFIYFFSVILISMFSFNPLMLIFGFTGALLYSFVISGIKYSLKAFFGYLLLVLIVGFTNPLFSHNGATAILFIDDNRVTLEAFIYGIVLGLSIVTVLCWFHCFNSVFDSEKTLYIFGRVSPKLALVVSMALNFIPAFIRRFKSVYSAQKNIGTSILKRYIYSFSAVVSQSLEDSIITSDSMKARGYNTGKRSAFSRFRFTVYDGIYLLIIVLLTAVSIAFIGDLSFEFYPRFIIPSLSLGSVLCILSFTALSFLPFIFETKENIKWKYSVSKI